MRTQKLALLITTAILGLSLSSCGKERYSGTYTGYQVSVPATGTTQTQTNYQNNTMYGSNQSSIVTANLNSNGETVTGTYSLSGGNTGYQNSGSTNTTYQFTANSSSSGPLSNVMLIPSSNGTGSNMSMSSCMLTGSLTSSNSGKSITGTLSPLNAGYCQSVQITLNRTN